MERTLSRAATASELTPIGAPRSPLTQGPAMHSDLLLVIVVGAALAFDFTNGFHDTANVVAASISTRALSPRTAVTLAAVLNFAGAFISLKVAATIGVRDLRAGKVTETIVFAGLIGAIAWNLITWFYGLPVELVARADRRRRSAPCWQPWAAPASRVRRC